MSARFLSTNRITNKSNINRRERHAAKLFVFDGHWETSSEEDGSCFGYCCYRWSAILGRDWTEFWLANQVNQTWSKRWVNINVLAINVRNTRLNSCKLRSLPFWGGTALSLVLCYFTLVTYKCSFSFFMTERNRIPPGRRKLLFGYIWTEVTAVNLWFWTYCRQLFTLLAWQKFIPAFS